MKILICVPVWNRWKITELVLDNLNKYKGDATLWVYNDWSTEYDNEDLKPYCDRVIKLPSNKTNKKPFRMEKNINGIGVQHLRWYQFREFLKQDEFEYIYMTDSDAIHDPNYINILKDTWNKYKGKNGEKFPICLYDTVWHSQKENLLKEGNDVWMRRTAPGISQFYSKSMVQKIVEQLDQQKNDPDYAWDYRCLEYLKLPTITTKTSYVEHFGATKDSIHANEGEWDRDKANNPTDYLKNIRRSVIDYLENKNIRPII